VFKFTNFRFRLFTPFRKISIGLVIYIYIYIIYIYNIYIQTKKCSTIWHQHLLVSTCGSAVRPAHLALNDSFLSYSYEWPRLKKLEWLNLFTSFSIKKWTCDLCELVILWTYYTCELWTCDLCEVVNLWTCQFVNLWSLWIYELVILSTCDNCELVILGYFYIGMFIDYVLNSDRYRYIFVPIFRFRCFRNTNIVSVSGVTVFNFVSNKNMETEIVLTFTDRFRPFSSLGRAGGVKAVALVLRRSCFTSWWRKIENVTRSMRDVLL
jgi:hypothetical protein